MKIFISFILRKKLYSIYKYIFCKIFVNFLELYLFFINKKLNGISVFYLIGNFNFWALKFKIEKNVFISNIETEMLVELVLYVINFNKKNFILDLCSGSSNLALSICNERFNDLVVSIDKSINALLLSKKNSINLKVNNIFFLCSDLFESVDYKFDIIVSNPPYISLYDIKFFYKNFNFKPFTSLFSLENGLFHINYIIFNSKNYLKNNGILILEHGFNQSNFVKKIFFDHGFIDIKTYKDLLKNDRITCGRIRKII